MIYQTADTRSGKDDAGRSIGTVTLIMDDAVYQALSAAVGVAYDDKESTPKEYEAAAQELWSFFNPGVLS